MGQETVQGVPKNEIETGERYCRSPMTGHWYRVTRWVDLGEGRIKAINKELMPEDWEPPEGFAEEAALRNNE